MSEAMCRALALLREHCAPVIPNFDEVFLGCESPIERRLLCLLAGQVHPSTSIEGQAWVTTTGGRYRVDFLATTAGGRRVAIEADGKEYHDVRRDERRDVDLICRGGGVDAVVRLRGCDVNFAGEGCLRCLRRFAPELFDPDKGPADVDPFFVRFAMSPSPTGYKPIVRLRVPITSATVAAVKLSKTCAIVGATEDGRHCVLEFRTPYWDWRMGEHDGVASLAEAGLDVLLGMVELTGPSRA